MKFVVYEVTDDFDILIKYTFATNTFLEDFLAEDLKSKNYPPKYLILESDDEDLLISITVYERGEISYKGDLKRD